MPTQWAHSFYFNNSSTEAAPTPSPVTVKHYPAWQPTVMMGSGFGVVIGLCLEWLRCAYWVIQRFYRLDPEQRAVVLTTMDALNHAAYPIARSAVKKTATTLGFNRPEAWKELSRELKSDPGKAENAFRHLEACRLVRANLLESTVTNPELHLITELAYHAFASKAK